MKNITSLTKKQAKRFKGILSDIDDTMTLKGKLVREGYEAIWKAYNAGLIVVPITGRPAGWCDMIARFFPVSGVIGENGAFYFYMEDGKIKRYFIDSEEERREKRKKLLFIKEEILKEIPTVKVSADQQYRESDLAIDFCEDVKDQGIETALKIKKIFEEYGAIAKISSIHVNGWFGNYNKLSTTKLFLKNVLKIELDSKNDDFIFFGDSPNDEPLFQFFKQSCGVANLMNFENLLTIKPTYITKKEGGKGLLDAVRYILAARS